MAEIVRLAASITTLASLAIRIASLANGFIETVPNFDNDVVWILKRFNKLGHSLAEWESGLQLESISGEEWGNTLLSTSVPKVQSLIREMTMNYERAQPAMEEIISWASHLVKTGKVNSSRWTSGFPRSEYEELLRLMDKLEGMNSQLYPIAPSLPSYPQDTDPQKDSNTVIDSIVQGRETVAIPMKLGELFNESLAALILLAHVSTDQYLFIELPRRFGQWGTGLFEGPASIDVLLDGSESRLRDVITRALVYIAVIESIIFSPPHGCYQG
jgi:hypothetical protein